MNKLEKIRKIISLILIAIVFSGGLIMKEYQWSYIGLLLLQCELLLKIYEKLGDRNAH